MIDTLDYWAARDLLSWQIEMGADEAILDAPIDRYQLAGQEAVAKAPAQLAGKVTGQGPVPEAGPGPSPAVTDVQTPDPVAEARAAAGAAADLPALRVAMDAYPHCELKRGARQLVFADGDPAARVMIVGEAPGRDEDREGRPFVGRAGQLLDRMLDAIDMGRAHDSRPVYITNVLPWRPPQNRTPTPEEIAMLLPFLERHVALAAPDMLIVMGNTPCQALLGRAGITRIRGQWTEALGRPTLPMVHPAYLLRNPAAKREAWADLLDLNAKLRSLS